MAVNSSVYSGREFALYISHDDTTSGVGTFNTNTSTQWKRVDINSFSFPNFNPIQEFEMRTGSGRIAAFDSVFTSEKGVVREISIEGRLNDEILQILGENVLGEAAASGAIVCGYDHQPDTLAHADSISAGDYLKSLSVYFESPVTGKSWKVSGAVCTSFQVSADMGGAAGRFDFTATLQTGYKPALGDISWGTQPTISSTYLYLSDLTSKSIIDGTGGFTDIDPLINSLGVTMAGGSQMLGMQGSDGDPEVIGRLIPELEVTYEMSIKYASDTAPLIEEYKATDQDIAIYLSNADEDSGSFPAGSSGIGFDINKSKLTSAELDTGDIANLNISGKMLAPSSGEAFVLLIS